MKVLITNRYEEEKLDKIKKLGYEVVYMKESKVKFTDEIKDVEVIVGYNPFKTLDISKLKNLKFIQLSSVGIDQVPKDKIIENKILICNNRGNYSIPMAEYIVMYILNIYKNTKNAYQNQNSKIWELDITLEELSEKKIGFIGTGTIAKEAVKRLKAFNVLIYGVNTNGRLLDGFEKCFSIDRMDDMLKICDIVVITVPSTKKTIGMINEDKIKKMKENLILINVGRGNIINEVDLIKNISKFRAVCLDVFEKEPLEQGSDLWKFENVTITPHNSWISNKNRERTFRTIYENLKKYINGEKVENIVDINKGY